MTTAGDEQPHSPIEQPTVENKEEVQDKEIAEDIQDNVKETEGDKSEEQNVSDQALSEQTKADSVDSGDTTPAPASSTDSSPQPATAASGTPWQAIFSPQYNAYYFYNIETQQTTWENPLAPSTPSSSSQPPLDPSSTTDGDGGTSSSDAYANQHAALEAAAIAAGIDPALAYLDPTLLSSTPSSSTTPAAAGLPPSFTAKFNARTGQFARPDARDPSHLSEQARAMRMSQFYFDVNAWEQQLAEQGGSIKGGEEEGKKRKRPSKKDLDRFKEQKRLKKLAKTAWLRT